MIILVPEEIHDDFADAARTIVPQAELRPYAETHAAVDGLEDAEAVLRWVAGKRFSDMVAQGPRVRWLHTASAGVDHVLTPDVRAKDGLTVTDSGPAFEIAISEFVLAWMLMVARRLPELMAHQRAHHWHSVRQQELYGQTVGIIGLGPIGRGVANRTKAFGMKTLGLRRHDAPVPNVDEVLTGEAGLERILRESDYVVLAAALTDDTRALLGPSQLAMMRPTAWLINIARGAQVDEPALINMLKNDRLAGACLDVFAKEPLPADSPLWDMPNVHIAPHNSSGWSEGLRARQKALFLDNLKRFVNGETLEGVVDIQQGY
jgi:phosphoglycerate dehydrogenase-like enzyme